MSDVCIKIKNTPTFENFVHETAFRFRKDERPARYWMVQKMLTQNDLFRLREGFFASLPFGTEVAGHREYSPDIPDILIDNPDFCLHFAKKRERHKELLPDAWLRLYSTHGPVLVRKGYDAEDLWTIDYNSMDICSLWNFSTPGRGDWEFIFYIPELKQEVTVILWPGEVLFFRGNLCPHRRPVFSGEEYLSFQLYYKAEMREVL